MFGCVVIVYVGQVVRSIVVVISSASVGCVTRSVLCVVSHAAVGVVP